MKYKIGFITILISAFIYAPAFAATIATENFDSYDSGVTIKDLTGGTGFITEWYGINAQYIKTSNLSSYNAPNSVTGTGATNIAVRDFNGQNTGQATFNIKISGDKYNSFILGQDTSTYGVYVTFELHNIYLNESILVGSISDSDFHTITITWNDTTQIQTAKLDNGEAISTGYYNTTTEPTDTLRIGINSTDYLDNIIISDIELPPPPPPAYTSVGLPTDGFTQTMAAISEQLKMSWKLIVIALGLPLGFYFIKKLIELFGAAQNSKGEKWPSGKELRDRF